MSDFLKLLIYKTATINGVRGTAIPVREILYKKEMKAMSKQGRLNGYKKMRIQKRLDFTLMKKTFTQYQMMRVRMKISFHAFIKNETILELWLKTIERSMKFLTGSG